MVELQTKSSVFDIFRNISTKSSAPLQYDHLFKIVVIGDYGSGKTNLMYRFVKGEKAPLINIGFDFLVHTLELDLKKIKLQIWDVSITQRAHAITRSHYRGAKGIMMVYDVTNRASFESIRAWKRDVDEYAHEDAVLMLVGNKCDLHHQRQVSIKEGKQLASEFGIWYMETSALEDVNVEQAFVSLTQDIKEKVENAIPATKNGGYISCCIS